MNKLVLLIILGFTTFFSFGQEFNIEPVIKDSINPSNYFYRVSGYGNFSDSLQLKVELVNNDDASIVLFSGGYDFLNATPDKITMFQYDKETMKFSFNIGEFENTNMFLHIWIIDEGEIKNEIYIN